MAVNIEGYRKIKTELDEKRVTLIAVSKTKSQADILALYNLGQRDFGENYVQELVDKYEALPKDIRWHFIGHLQSNKIKQISPFVHLIHGVDSPQLLSSLNSQAEKSHLNLEVLLQVDIASESTKFGFSVEEARRHMEQIMKNPYERVKIRGFMGMATFTEDQNVIKKEFQTLKLLYDEIKRNSDNETANQFNILSMGMTSDYKIALSEGSTMVRIGSAIFGERDYTAR